MPWQKLRVQSKFLFLLFFLVSIETGRAEPDQPNLYPLSAPVTLWDQAYRRALNTVYKTSDTVQLSTWTVMGSSWSWIYGEQEITVWEAVSTGATTYELIQDTWTLNRYANLLSDEIMMKHINNVVNEDMLPYMVDPSTGPCESGWNWHLGTVNGKLIPVACQ